MPVLIDGSRTGFLSTSHQGRGIMTAAVKLLVEWASKNMNVTHISALTHEGNIGSFMVF